MIKRAIKSLGRLLGVEITRVKAERLSTLLQDKVDLIDFAFSRFNLHSFADLGGVWRVEGGYTFYTLDKYDGSVGAIVDTLLTDVIHSRARKLAQLRVIRGNRSEERRVGI